MTVDFDPAGDLADVADGNETVTFRRRGSGSGSDTSVAGALRRAMSVREAAQSNGRYTASDVTWHLPAGELNDPPRLGDLIVDNDGGRWTVLDVQSATMQTRWRCACRSLTVVYGLDDTIDVLAATYTKDGGGAAEPTWRPWKTGIRARIQPASAKMGTEHGARRTVTRYHVFVEEDLTLDHTHRIQCADGTVYKVVGTKAAERIGELQTIEIEATPWPAG